MAVHRTGSRAALPRSPFLVFFAAPVILTVGAFALGLVVDPARAWTELSAYALGGIVISLVVFVAWDVVGRVLGRRDGIRSR